MSLSSARLGEIQAALTGFGKVVPLPSGSINALTQTAVREHIPEGLTIIFEAPQRFGKTLGGVMWALDAHQHGKNIFSNIQLGFPHEKLEFTEIKLEDGRSRYWNGHIFIDELNFYYDCRRSMSGANVEFGAFLLQQKKQGCSLTGTTHSLASLDLRIREHFDYLIQPEVYPRYPAVPQMIKLRITNGPLQKHMNRTLKLDCRPYLGLYDSFAVYDPFKNRAEPEPPVRRGRRVEL